MKNKKKEEIDLIIGEQTDWNAFGSQHVRRKFVIPIDGMSKEEAEKQLQELMCDYKEDIKFDENCGGITVSFNKTVPVSSSSKLQNVHIKRLADLYGNITSLLE